MKNLLLSLTIGLTAMGCRDKEEPQDQLPPITQHGANTFGAVINGKVMVPRGYKTSSGWTPGPQYLCTYYRQESYVYKYEVINATDCKATERGRIYISMEMENGSFVQKGTYSFENATLQYYESPPKGIMMQVYVNKGIYLSIANTGSITIARNDDEVISGTFSCKLKNKDNPNDVIEVKDGRFDFNKATIYNTYFP